MLILPRFLYPYATKQPFFNQGMLRMNDEFSNAFKAFAKQELFFETYSVALLRLWENIVDISYIEGKNPEVNHCVTQSL
jgi:hypothetical protein